jgi:hypothetical protein
MGAFGSSLLALFVASQGIVGNHAAGFEVIWGQ